MVGPKPYPAIFEAGGEENFHPVAAMRTMFVDSIDRSAAETIVEQLQASTAMMAATQLRVLGGAVAQVPADATAYAHRQSRIMVNVAAIFGSPDEAPEHEPWVNGLADALRHDDQRRIRQLPRRRGRGADPRRVPRRDLGPARGGQAPLRPDEPLPPQPEHPTRLIGHPVGSEVRASQRSSVRASSTSVSRVWRSDRS